MSERVNREGEITPKGTGDASEIKEAISELEETIRETKKEAPPPQRLTLEEMKKELKEIDPRLEVQEVYTRYARGVPQMHLEIFIQVNNGGIVLGKSDPVLGSPQKALETKGGFPLKQTRYHVPPELFKVPFLIDTIRQITREIKSGEKPRSLFSPASPSPGVGYNKDGYTATRKPGKGWEFPQSE